MDVYTQSERVMVERIAAYVIAQATWLSSLTESAKGFKAGDF